LTQFNKNSKLKKGQKKDGAVLEIIGSRGGKREHKTGEDKTNGRMRPTKFQSQRDQK
jgi:hypothetical protein